MSPSMIHFVPEIMPKKIVSAFIQSLYNNNVSSKSRYVLAEKIRCFLYVLFQNVSSQNLVFILE